MLDVLQSLVGFIGNGLSALVNGLLSLLPGFDVDDFLGEVSDAVSPHIDWLQCLNWFVPVKDMLEVTALWAAALVAWWAYSHVSSWIRSFLSK